ncbi:prolipoprotein diacylglyceryl transferase [Acidipila sp. EB88]|uniref:prolipoprotein diacylglyceryl transferase n=1 Tax=Acidipila sp. EB88 TaxID=2305226 RepID=UPI000F5E4085|nr:prolipoprotein diacylglyceryl transferase family protein [Acidipila sp. EB88]RRA49525.1 prolipoprotein diacylglyceryl transferase [Acidipila sp. EB88]
MIPFLHIGRFALPTFGLMLALAALSAGFLLHRNLRRYALPGDAVGIIAIATIAGVLGAKLWHVLQDPALLIAHPEVLLDRAGLAWFGGLVGGIVALLWQAREVRVRSLSMLDLCAPSAALGYGIGRIGCFTSGDGDYGIASNLPWAMSFPHGIDPVNYPVHPTPLYECLVALGIAVYLWRRSRPAAGRLLNAGRITGEYLVLSGAARFLVEFIRLNPRIYWGLSNAQVASVGSMAAGLLLVAYAGRHSIAAVLRDEPVMPVEEAAH